MNLSVKTANTKAIQIGDEFRMNSPVKTPNTKAIQFSDEFRMNSSTKMVNFQHKRNQDELRMGLLSKSDNQHFHSFLGWIKDVLSHFPSMLVNTMNKGWVTVL